MTDIAAQMLAMAEIGLSRHVIGAFADVFLAERLSADERRFLRGPLIIHRNGWTDTLPKWLPELVGAERVCIVFGSTPQYIVGPAEISAVMYPATLAAPLDSYHCDLYVWATVKAYAKWKGMEADAAFESLMGMQPIPDAAVLTPSGRLFHTYQYLALDIRQRIITSEIERERKQKPGRQQPKIEAEPAFISEQVSLFGEEEETA